MDIRDNLLYTKDHEWVDISDNKIKIGITDFAQGELGDIIFVELPNTESTVSKGESAATIEAVKTVADVYTPISGKIVEVNTLVEDTPELINSSPYDDGWIVTIESDESIDSNDFLSANEYKEFIGI